MKDTDADEWPGFRALRAKGVPEFVCELIANNVLTLPPPSAARRLTAEGDNFALDGETEAAIAVYEKALAAAVVPNHIQAVTARLLRLLQRLSSELMVSGEFDAAVGLLEKRAKLATDAEDRFEFSFDLGLAQLAAAHTSEALASFQRSIEAAALLPSENSAALGKASV